MALEAVFVLEIFMTQNKWTGREKFIQEAFEVSLLALSSCHEWQQKQNINPKSSQELAQSNTLEARGFAGNARHRAGSEAVA